MKKTLLMMLLAMLALGVHADPKEITLKTGGKMKVFLPADDKANGRAIVLCPGGGYSYLSDANEGTDWAGYFNEMGYVVSVLYYRMPLKQYTTYPLDDAEEAVLYLRRRGAAGLWPIKDGCVGVMGFSAGGHVASTLATHKKAESGARPDFQILFYPVITMDPMYTHMDSHDNLLGNTPTDETKLKAYQQKEVLYSNEKQVTDETPMAFITYAADDGTVPVDNAKNYYNALVEHHVQAYIKEYPSGGHGFGWYKASFAYHDDLLGELTNWLKGLDEFFPNGVETPTAENLQQDTMIYTLDGRPVGMSLDGLARGIYIREGKKVCIP